VKFFIGIFLAIGIPILVGLGLWSIKDKHFGVTNVCNEQFYPDLCGKDSDH
jgi:uncharacterized membrane protein